MNVTRIFLIASGAFLFGFLGVGIGFYIHAQQPGVLIVPIPDRPTPRPTFALVPPSQAVSGTLTLVTGHAQKLSREDSEYKEASSGATILLGESIATKEHSSAVTTVNGIVTATIGEGGELVFANLFPNNFVLQQKAGKIDYMVVAPISVRVLHTLVAISSGEIAINVIDTDVSVTVKSGTAKIALVDTDNNTNVWTVDAGQRANIDDAARRVYLVRAR